GAIKESIDYAERTIACLERMPQNKDVLKNIVNVRTILGIRFMDMGHLNESHKIISPIIETASGLGHSRRIAQINIILGMYYFYIKEDFTTAFEYYDKALAESRSLNDAGLWAMANYWRGIPLSFNCDFNEAESCFVESGNVHQRAEEWIWLSIVKSFISHLVKYHQGEIDQAVQTGREVMRLAEKSGDIYSKLFAHCTLGTACYGIGDLDRAVDHFVAGLTIGERINHYFWNCHANHYLGDTYFELGDMQNAMNHYHKANGLFLEIGHMPSWARLNDLALRLTELNTEERPDFDPESLGDYSAANKLCVYDGLIKRRIGEIMMSLGRFEEAEHWIAQAVETHERHGMRFHLAGDYAVKAEQCKLGGDLSRGREHLVMARSIYKDCGAPGWVEIMDERLAAMA
ncbi:MAG: hypothetical protein KKC37_06030, partial [Proteobacteria bacterium]|nr:hypothetical protein [Pseudomonadota bacterium]